MTRTWNNRIFLGCALLCAIARADEPVKNIFNMPPKLVKGIGVEQHMNAQLPLDLELVEEDGRKVALREFFGKRPVAISMVYYKCPNICTMTISGVFKALQQISFTAGKDFEWLFVSIDPKEKDLLARTKHRSYLKSFPVPGGENGVHFLTGDEFAIRQLATTIGFQYKWDDETAQFAHPASLTIATPHGKVSRYIYGVEFEPRDLRLALVEASQNKIGSPIDKFLLFCFHYDPKLGAYGPMVMNLLRLFGVLTVIGLGIIITTFLRSDRRKKRLLVAN